MKSIWNNPWFMIPALVFFNVGLALLYYITYGDEILFFNGLREEPFNTLFRFITLLGEAYAYIAFGIAAMFLRYRYALLIALTGLVTLPTSFFLKDSVGADRPITYFSNRDMRESVVTVPGVVLNTGQTSFPSGHSMAAFGLYSMLTLIAGKKRRRLGLIFASTAILVGVSRIFLVQHFLADILAGAGLGLLVSWLVWRLGDAPVFRRWTALEGGLLTQGGNTSRT